MTIFLPIVGMLVAWRLSHWPTWSRVVSTVWTVVLVIAAVELAVSIHWQA